MSATQEVADTLQEATKTRISRWAIRSLRWNPHQMMLFLMLAGGEPVRTTVTLDDELMTAAREYVDIKDTSGLLREALKSLIEREAARRLSALGGTEPQLELPHRRRSA